MEQQRRPYTSSEQGKLVTCSFPSRILCRILQLSFVKYLLKILQKASVWIGFVVPVETIISKVYPTQSPTRPRRSAKKRRGRLTRLLLSAVPTRIQSILGYLPADWGWSNMPKESREALTSSSKKANKRKRDDVALEEQESLLVVLERDLPEDDPDDLTYEPSDLETDSEEYMSQNDTEADLELDEQDGIIMLKDSSDLQASGHAPHWLHVLSWVEDIQPIRVSDAPELRAASMELGSEDPAGSSSGEGAPDTDSSDGDTQKAQAGVSSGDGSEQEADADCDDSSSLSQYGVRTPLC
ncbi:ww domain-binding protein 11-like protein [Limosa lapponica baueri]|uniref:Ww domain-binding protein 11-like protein n=1 Tax=Limosa lapponica baueri TaxID=1758121 RepID=A0A2I0T5H8_LIMLA|nr:ww domain-binding protein 11-like protein [Limosa lapponica baueri]